MKISPKPAKDLKPGDRLSYSEHTRTHLVTSVGVWGANDPVVVTYEVAGGQAFTTWYQPGDEVWVEDPNGRPHPAEASSDFVTIRRRDLLDALAWIEDGGTSTADEVLVDALQRLESAAAHV